MSEYFSDLNYSLGNEDTNFERELVKRVKPQKIFSICGSGSRVFPMVQTGVAEMHCLDLATQQLALASLREQTFKKCNHDDFLKFWGHAPYREDQNQDLRRQIFNTLEFENKKVIQNYFEKLNWNSLLYEGRWEKTFIFISKILGSLFNTTAMFSFDNIEEQRRYFDRKFPRLRWNMVVFLIGQKVFFNRVLYHGKFIIKNVEESYLEYYKKAYDHLFTHDLAKNSFFLQLCFLGRVQYAQGNPIEAHPQCFAEIKKNINQCQVFYHQGDACKIIQKNQQIDFVSLSDVPSYFSGEQEKTFLNDIVDSLSKGAHVVVRSYLRVPKADRSLYEDVTHQFGDIITNETVQMYQIEVLRKK